MKYARLMALRATREREEAEISAAYRAAADRYRQEAAGERHAREGLERIMRSKVAPIVLEEMGRRMGRDLQHEIMTQVVTSLKVTPETTITVPTGMLMSADPKSVVSRVIDWWKMEIAPKIDFRAVRGDQEFRSHTTTVEVRVPEMRLRQAVDNGVL